MLKWLYVMEELGELLRLAQRTHTRIGIFGSDRELAIWRI